MSIRFTLSKSWPVSELLADGQPINPRRHHARPTRALSRHPLALRPYGHRLLWALAEERREHLRLERLRSGVSYLPIHMRGTDRWFKETDLLEELNG